MPPLVFPTLWRWETIQNGEDLRAVAVMIN